jgi:DNA-binding MarR family transcriptional regulator
MKEQYISLKQLSDRLGMDRSHARRYLKKLGIKTQKRRTADSGSQLCLTVTEEQAEKIIAQRRNEGFLGSGKAVASEFGVFYVIQLVPELDPTRIKLGFAIDMNDRLAQHRTAAPTASILKTWPCKRLWEQTVMDSLVADGCRHMLNEVYECDDLAALSAKGEELFRLLPDPTKQIELSEKSPLRQ